MSKPKGFYKRDGSTRPITPRKAKSHASAYAPRTRARRESQTPKNMPKNLQIQLLKKRFKILNPEEGADMVDWDASVGNKENFQESLADLKAEYPMYRWDKRDLDKSYDDMEAQRLRGELKDFGYVSMKRVEYARVKHELAEHESCEAEAERTRRVPEQWVHVDQHRRRWPD